MYIRWQRRDDRLTADLAESYRDEAQRPQVRILAYLGSIHADWAQYERAEEEQMRFWLRALGALRQAQGDGKWWGRGEEPLFSRDDESALVEKLKARVRFPTPQAMQRYVNDDYMSVSTQGRRMYNKGYCTYKIRLRELQGWDLLQELTAEEKETAE